MTGYTLLLIPQEAGGYAAEVLELPGCYAEGRTADEAMQALQRAAAAWIEVAQAQGQTIPPPLGHHAYQGKIALRLPRALHRRAALHAAAEGVSLNQILATAIAYYLGAYSR